MSNQLNPNPYNDIIIKIAQQRLSQASISFKLAIFIHIICFLISLGGWSLILLGKFSEGTITSTTGLISSAGFLKFAKESSDRLDNILAELDDTNH